MRNASKAQPIALKLKPAAIVFRKVVELQPNYSSKGEFNMQAAVTARISNLNLTLAPSIARPRPCSVHLQHCASRPQHQRLDRQQQLLSRWSRPLHLALAERTSSPTSSSSGDGSSSSSSTGSAFITDSDISFLMKLLAFSFAGAALIKYGSLAFELPFHPSVAGALTLVLGTPAAYSLFLLTKGDTQQ